eukprot:287942_1
MSFKLRFLFIACALVAVSQEQTILYVSSNGSDESNDCSRQSPCGSLYSANYVREYMFSQKETDNVEIIIDGFNNKTVKYSWSPIIKKASIVTFNISTAEFAEWIDSNPESSAIYTRATVEINNLHLENYQFKRNRSLLSVVRGNLILNNCIMRNITISDSEEYALIVSQEGQIEIHNSVFDNIISPKYASFIHVVGYYTQLITLKGCIFNNIMCSTDFILISGMNLLMKNCVFNNVFLNQSDSIINLYSRNQIYFEWHTYINDSAFTNINGGSIITIPSDYENTVYLDNISITTSSAYTRGWYNTDNALIVIELGAKLEMSNIILKYQWMSKINDVCKVVHRGDTRFSEIRFVRRDLILLYVNCKPPYQFIRNSGFVVINNCHVTNDITKKGLHEFRESIIQNATDIVQFRFGQTMNPTTDELVSTIIYNDRGEIEINSLNVYGVGLNQHILYNTGIANISELTLKRPRYYFENDVFLINRYFMLTAVTHIGLNSDFCQANGLSIHGLNVSGVGEYGVYIARAGFVSIKDVSIAHTYVAIEAHNSIQITVKDSTLSEIGSYYFGDLTSVKKDVSISRSAIYLENIQYIMIHNNKFVHFPGNGYIHIINSKRSIIEIKENLFQNVITWEQFAYYYHSQWNQTYPSKLELAQMFKSSSRDSTATYGIYPFRDHFISIYGYASSITVGNQFEVDELVMMMDIANLGINSDLNDSLYHCISQNTFHGYAIQLIQSNVSSCVHSDFFMKHDTKCWETLGTINVDIKHTQRFIATNMDIPLIKLKEGSSIILDNTIISTTLTNNNYNYSYNPISIEGDGAMSFLDVVINESNIPIKIHFYRECINLCSQLYKGNINNIHQAHINCINISNTTDMITLQDSKSLTPVSHTFPREIELSSSEYFYPGAHLNISYKILDRYGNEVDYDKEIFILLSSDYFNFQIIMAIKPEANSSYFCDICETGLYIQNARIDDKYSFNQTKRIQAKVVDDILLINSLNVSVAECPSGYGLHQTSSQCHECSIGQFSIESSVLPCYVCDDAMPGVQCLGGNKIKISRNYWIAINYTENEDIISQYCPSNYCTQRSDALYLNLSESKELCALNRNLTTPLCGQCQIGYSEMFGSANCGKCTENYYSLLLIIAIVSILLSIIIIFNSAIPINRTGEYRKYGVSNCIKCFRKTFYINDQAKSLISTSLSKPILYYYQ